MSLRLLLALAGAASIVSAGLARAQEPVETSLAIPPASFAHAATYLAADLDIFHDNGLTLRLVDAPADGGLAAVRSGSVDWTLASGLEFARAAGGAPRLLAIANLVERPLLEIVLKKTFADQGKFDPRGLVATRGKLLRGRSIAVDPATPVLAGWLRIVAARAGLDPDKDFRIVTMPEAAMAGAMASGGVDAYVASSPVAAAGLRDGAGVILASALAGDAPELLPGAWSLLTTRDDSCQKRRVVCEKIVKSYVEATRVMRDESLRTTLALKRRFPGLADEALKASIEAIRRATPIFPAPTAQALLNTEAFGVAAGIVKAEDARKSFDGLFTADFVR